MNNEHYSKTNPNKPNSSPKLEPCSTLSEVEGPIKANSAAFFRIPASGLRYIAASAKLTALPAPGGPQNYRFFANFHDIAIWHAVCISS
jgi:hypothetical protein